MVLLTSAATSLSEFYIVHESTERLLTTNSVQLPKLDDVRGAMNLQSSEQINGVCDYFEPLASSNNVIKGPYTCAGERSNPRGQGTLQDGTSSGSGGDSSESPNAANHRYISGATGVLGVIAAIFGML